MSSCEKIAQICQEYPVPLSKITFTNSFKMLTRAANKAIVGDDPGYFYPQGVAVTVEGKNWLTIRAVDFL